MADAHESQPPAEDFIGEPITPVPGTGDARAMARGGPGLPRRFRWRGEEYEVAEVLETHRTLGPCTHGSGEQYVRKHWFTFRTSGGEVMTVYCDRRPRRGASPKARWWLVTLGVRGGGPPGPPPRGT
jgi:phosphoribosylglycinamide formyltransferase-1